MLIRWSWDFQFKKRTPGYSSRSPGGSTDTILRTNCTSMPSPHERQKSPAACPCPGTQSCWATSGQLLGLNSSSGCRRLFLAWVADLSTRSHCWHSSIPKKEALAWGGKMWTAHSHCALSLCVFVSLSVSLCMSLLLSFYVSLCMSECVSLSLCLSFLSVSLFLSLCMCLSVCLCISLSLSHITVSCHEGLTH